MFTGSQVSTFEPVEVKTFVMMLPLVIFSLFMQKVDVANQEEKELAKDDPDPEVLEAQQHFLEL